MPAWDNVSLQGPPQAPSYAAPQIGMQLGALLGNLPQDYQQAQQGALGLQQQQAALALQQLQLRANQDYYNQAGQGGGNVVGNQGDGSAGQALTTSADPRGKIPVIMAAAQKYGVDPRTAVAVARSEGLAQFSGDGGKSGGAFQLYTGGGLGNEFQKETGLDPLDQKNEDATIDWAMKNAARTGWKPYNGAKKIGITGFQGIGQQTASADPNFMPQRGAQPPQASAESAQQPGASTTQVAQAAPQRAPQAEGEPEDNPRVRALDKRIEDETNKASRLAKYSALVPQAKADMENAMQQAKLLQERRQQLVGRLGGERKMQLETEETRKRGEQAADTASYGKEYADTQQKGEDASKAAQTLHLAQAFMSDPSFDSGTFASNKLAYKRFMVAIGKGDSSQALTQEGFKKATSEAILEQLKSLGGLGLGQVKAKEFETMQKAAQSEENTPTTNRLLTEMGLRLAERWQIPLAQQAREYRASHGGHLDAGWDEQKAKYVEGTPLFSPDELSDVRRIAPVFARTPQEAMAKHWHEGEPLRVPDPATGGTRIITHLQVRVPAQGGGPMVAPAQQER